MCPILKLADYIHSLGLKFGIHIMRGIPRQAVLKNTPVSRCNAYAADIALNKSKCAWLNHMYGVDVSKPGGQAYYDSLFQLYAKWEVDYVKVDDISYFYDYPEMDKPFDRYGKSEIEACLSRQNQIGKRLE